MNLKPSKLYLDQYGNHFFARTLAELRGKVGGGRVSIMYNDKTAGPDSGKTVRIGYVIGQHWLRAYVREERVI